MFGNGGAWAFPKPFPRGGNLLGRGKPFDLSP